MIDGHCEICDAICGDDAHFCSMEAIRQHIAVLKSQTFPRHDAFLIESLAYLADVVGDVYANKLNGTTIEEQMANPELAYALGWVSAARDIARRIGQSEKTINTIGVLRK